MSEQVRIILLVILLLLSAFFSMTECALSYCNKIKLKVAADEGSKSSKMVLKCLDKFDKKTNKIVVHKKTKSKKGGKKNGRRN